MHGAYAAAGAAMTAYRDQDVHWLISCLDKRYQRFPEVCRCVECVTQSLTLLGPLMCRWSFTVQVLGDHVVAVALGPPEDVVDAWGVIH